MPGWFPPVVAAASIGLTYLFCIRPMRRGHCGPGSASGQTDPADRRAEEIARLRTEIDQLNRDLQNDSPRPARKP